MRRASFPSYDILALVAPVGHCDTARESFGSV
jgi:hypothetical protein